MTDTLNVSGEQFHPAESLIIFMENIIKNVLITGGGQNFGLALVNGFLNYPDLRVIILTRDATSLKQKLNGYPNIFSYKPLDYKSNKTLLNKIQKKFGQIDILINNATLNTQTGFKDFVENSDDKKVEEYYLTNSVSPLLMTKYVLLGSDKSKIIINILAGRALTGHSRHVEYYSSKAALYNATITLSNDYKKHDFINVMMGKIDIEDRKQIDKIVVYLRNVFVKHNKRRTEQKMNYKEVYFFFDRLAYLKHRATFFIKNFYNSKRV